MLLAAVVLLVLLSTAAVAVLRPNRAMAVTLAVVAILWIVVSSPLEGPVLIRLSYNHGVTVADLISVAGWILAAAIWRGVLGRRNAVMGRRGR